MTRPGIEPRSPGRLANTLTARPIAFIINLEKFVCHQQTQTVLCIAIKFHIYIDRTLIKVFQKKKII